MLVCIIACRNQHELAELSSIIRILILHITDKDIPLAIPPLKELPHHNRERINIALLHDIKHLHVLLRNIPRTVIMYPTQQN
jgi:hypothetical protein